MATAMELTEVPPYVSDEEEDMNDSVTVKRKSTKKRQYKWKKEKMFNNAGDVQLVNIEELGQDQISVLRIYKDHLHMMLLLLIGKEEQQY